jgi:putative tryptophan/tyrosine transport system substrate-binding protein
VLRAAAEQCAEGLAIIDFPIRDAAELPSVLDAIGRAKPDGLVVDNDVHLVSKAKEIAAVGLPAISGSRDFTDAGLLHSYGASIFDIVRHLGSYIDRILKGAKPGDLPIEQPTKFELVVNMKTAQRLGLTVPPLLLVQANKVIE